MIYLGLFMASLVAQMVKNLPAGDTRDSGSVPGSGRSPGEGNGYPFQYSCPDNSMDRGAWWAMVRVFTKSNTIEQLTHFLEQMQSMK